MFRYKTVFAFIFTGAFAFAQNDLDAIRYSRMGVGGTSRFISMGGAFGAIGADLSSASYNPAGLGVYRKGDISFSGGLRFTDNTASIYNKTGSTMDANAVFNNFGLAIGWKSDADPESRHVLAFTNTQLQNFNSKVRMTGYTNSSSIAKDMLNLATQQKNINSLNPGYENLGFNTYLIDTADTGSEFFSSLDTKRSVKQTRDIVTSGRVNDINFSYAYSYKDKYYFGVSVGIPQVNYQSTTTHTEADDRDSMRVTFNQNGTSFTSTYIADLPYAYTDKLGFNNLTYTEYFKTTGSGFNLKLGGIARLSDAFRLGFYVHTPTFYKLTDTYYNSLSVTYDKSSTPIDNRYPKDDGYFTYRLRTPARFSLNAAYILDKLLVVGLDYEMVNYKGAQLGSDNLSDFANANTTIAQKYSVAHNVKLGAELNVKPLMIRAGYVMQGSPFGDAFTGDFVRHTISAGVGFRTSNNFYVDFVVYRTMTNENYYLFTTLNTYSKIKYSSTMAAATVGFKF